MKKKIISLLVLPILFSCSNNDMANVQNDLLIDG